MHSFNFKTEFTHKDIVFLAHDIEQKPRMVTAVIIAEKCIMYEVISGVEVSQHYAWELTKEKNICL